MPRGENRPQFGNWATFQKRPDQVRAARVRNGQRARVLIEGGFTWINAGDWLVIWPDGKQEVYTDAQFTAKFAP